MRLQRQRKSGWLGRPWTRLLAPLALATSVAACSPLQSVVHPTIEADLKAYRTELNDFVALMERRQGAARGSYAVNRSGYVALNDALSPMIARAREDAGGTGCRLRPTLAAKLTPILDAETLRTIQRPQGDTRGGSTSGCTLRLLQMQRAELSQLAALHEAGGASGLSTAGGEALLDSMNRGIDATQVVVEAARQEQPPLF